MLADKYKSKYLLMKRQVGGKHNIIAISGISGAGKTTIGKLLAKRLNGIYIDQDTFFKKDKPKVKLSDGSVTSNWDCLDAIDISAFNNKIKEELANNKIIIVGGFALWNEMFDNDTKPNIHFHIRIPRELSLETRLKVKNFTQENRLKQKLIFDELVYPFYQETLKHSEINYFIEGLDMNGNRKSIDDMINEIISKGKYML